MIKDGVTFLVSIFDNNPHVLRVILEFWCQVSRNEMITALNTSMHDFLMRTIAIIVQEGGKRGVFKKRDPQLAAYTLMSAVVGFAFNHVINRRDLESKKLEEELSDLILGYVCN